MSTPEPTSPVQPQQPLSHESVSSQPDVVYTTTDRAATDRPASQPVTTGQWAAPQASTTGTTTVTTGTTSEVATPAHRRVADLLKYAAIPAVLALVGSFGPWATASGYGRSASINGTSGDGKLTLLLALVALAAAVYGMVSAGKQAWVPWVVAVAGAIIAIISVIDLGQVGSVDGTYGVGVSIGWGLVLTLVSGLALAALGVMAALAARRRETTATTVRTV